MKKTAPEPIPENKPIGLVPIRDVLATVIKPGTKPLSPIQERLLSMPYGQEAETILYQHSVLCQTSMPYRDPGDDVRMWRRRNGLIVFELQAGRVMDPSSEDFIDVGLPFGPKPRLVLYHLNAEALRTQSPSIELEDSLTAFVRRTLGLDPKGRNIKTVKHQLSRLAAADFRIGAARDGRAISVKGSIIDGLELWTPNDPRQKILWPSQIHFSPRYFQSLMDHAVPLDEAAVTRLSNSAMGLDVYTWLAQRLHRVDPRKPAFVPWISLKDQFGHGYDRMDNFKRVFRHTLTQVKIVYRDAKFSLDDKGMTVQHSRPPVLRRQIGPGAPR